LVTSGGKEARGVMSRTKYNFAAASGREGELVYGCERPGAADELNKVAAIAPQEVQEWCAFMQKEGISRAVCLLNEEEHSFYQPPGYLGGLTAAGFAADKVTLVDLTAPDAAERTGAALKAAKDAGEKLVLHCAGGEGRTGTVLAQWLKMEGLGDSEKVCADMVEYANSKNAVRKPSAAKVDKFLSTGTLAK